MSASNSSAPIRCTPAGHAAGGRRAFLRALSLTPLAATLAACGGGGSDFESEVSNTVGAGSAGGAAASTDQTAAAVASTTRRWRMGFGGIPPSFDHETVQRNTAKWMSRAEMAAIHDEIPWTDLLAGADPEALLQEELVPMVEIYRSKGLKLLFVPELNDGMARQKESPQLRTLGRSLVEPEVQAVWRAWVMAAARVLQPDWICLGTETNLARLWAPAALYNAIRKCANDVAIELRAANLPKPPVLISSVHVETAWGKMGGQTGVFEGISKDRADFPFSQCLGLSSYPCLVLGQPEDMPSDWYQRVVAGSSMPTMISECGWSSVVTGVGASSEDMQRRYVERHGALLDSINAIAVVQLFFSDMNTTTGTPSTPDSLPAVANIGLCDTEIRSKPALAAWDKLFARRLSTRAR